MSIEQFISEKREKVNNELARILSLDSQLDEAARYTMLGPSHRWRPIVTIAAAEMYDVPVKEILPIACAIEILHGASIIIDDSPSFDNFTLRRGRPTLHRAYSEDLAILTSFYLIDYLVESLFLSKNNLPQQIRNKLFDYLLRTKAEMIQGEYEDIKSKGISMSPNQILKMYEQKSGSLFGLSAVAGGIVGRTDEVELEHLERYGRNMGTAYQILDDILDIEAQPEEIGKDVGKDKDKPNLPSTIGIDDSRKKAQELRLSAQQALKYLGKNVEILNDLVEYIALMNNKKITSSIIKF